MAIFEYVILKREKEGKEERKRDTYQGKEDKNLYTLVDFSIDTDQPENFTKIYVNKRTPGRDLI